MDKKIIINLLLFTIGGIVLGQSQEILTVEETIKIALENNYQIKTARNDLEIAELGSTPGQAGMLPQVAASVTEDRSVQNITQVRSNGDQIVMDNAKNYGLNYGVALEWTVFDGLRMFANREQLKENENLGEAELKQTILDKVGEVMTTYYDLVQQQQQLSALDSTLTISVQRVELAQNRFTIGKASKLEVLNAQVDLNTDRTLMQRQMETYTNTKILLNEQLARDIKIDFKVIPEIFVDQNLDLEELEAKVAVENPILEAEKINKRIRELQLKQIKASRYPRVYVVSGYNVRNTENSVGFTTSSDTKGFNYGFGASLNLFDGFNQNRNEKMGKVALKNAEISIAQQEQALASLVNTTYQTYLTNISLMKLEATNEEIARENLEITVEKYRIGIIPTIEFRTAQLNYINASVRLSNAKYQAKVSEILLKQLAGNLQL